MWAFGYFNGCFVVSLPFSLDLVRAVHARGSGEAAGETRQNEGSMDYIKKWNCS